VPVWTRRHQSWTASRLGPLLGLVSLHRICLHRHHRYHTLETKGKERGRGTLCLIHLFSLFSLFVTFSLSLSFLSVVHSLSLYFLNSHLVNS
jgi:hypothetical protein